MGIEVPEMDYSYIKKLAIVLGVSFVVTVCLLFVTTSMEADAGNEKEKEQQNVTAGSEAGLTQQGEDYVKNNIGKLDQDSATRLVIDYEKELKEKKKLMQKRFVQEGLDTSLYSYFTGNDNSRDMVLERIVERNDYDEVKNVYDMHLRIVKGNDSKVYPIVDYPYILKQYGEYMYDAAKKYIEIKCMAVEDPVILGNKLQLSFSELGKRLVDFENKLAQMNVSDDPNVTVVKSVLKDKLDKEISVEIYNLYEMYFYLYMKGESSAATCSIVDSTNGKIKTDLINSYKGIIESYPKTELAKSLKEYVAWLESHNNFVTKVELNAYFASTDKTIENIKAKAKF